HAVRDPQDPGELGERRRVGVELQQVVDAFAFVVDLVREAAPAPCVVAHPRAAALLDEVAGARDDLLLALLRQVGIEHQQDFVRNHAPEPPSSGLNRPRRLAPLGNGRRDGEAGSRATVASTRMRRPAAWLLGAFAAADLLRRRKQVVAALEPESGPDPRAEELRRKLAESRTFVEERVEIEAAETTVDQAYARDY